MSANQPVQIERGEGIDIFAMIALMWRYRYLIAASSILFALLAVWYALTAKEIFRAEAVITEVHNDSLSGQNGVSGQLGGLASLAGLNVGNNADANSQTVLASRHLIEEFVKSHDLVAVLTAKGGKRATLWFAVKRFQETVVKIHDDQLKGFTSVSMDWTDAATAAKWANDFVALANQLIRTRVIADATRNVAYLTKQLEQAKEVEVQRSLSTLLENETKTLMLANGRVDYAFRLVDPAVPPEVRHSPQRTLLVISGTAVGFFLGFALAFGIDAFRRRKIAV
jgi:LPS O-antigen subunit length determinant protein (WzzB/FepE family)